MMDDHLTCPHCNQPHPAEAQFCPVTGAALPAGPACPHCRHPVRPEWLACPHCGREMPQPFDCPNCGQTVQLGWKACPHCGQRVKRGSRRAAAAAVALSPEEEEKARQQRRRRRRLLLAAVPAALLLGVFGFSVWLLTTSKHGGVARWVVANAPAPVARLIATPTLSSTPTPTRPGTTPLSLPALTQTTVGYEPAVVSATATATASITATASPVATSTPAFTDTPTPTPFPSSTRTRVPPTRTPRPLPTSTPTPTPTPFVSFYADSTSITLGSCTTLHWATDNVRAVFFNGEGVAGNDSRQMCPANTQTYTLHVEYAGAGTDLQIVVQVDYGAAQPFVDAARADLAARLGIGTAGISVVSTEYHVWNDASMGCPEAGKIYAQVIVSGYLIILSDGVHRYDYRNSRFCRQLD